LKKYGVRVIELGVQSLDDEVLALSERGHTAAEVYRASGLIKEYGFALGIQIMPGLPGDTLERTLATARKVVALEPQLVRIYPAVTLKGTAMEELIRTGAYKPLSLEEAITWCAELVPLFREPGLISSRWGFIIRSCWSLRLWQGPFIPPLVSWWHPECCSIRYARLWRRITCRTASAF
jgi:histone acetyltransferase (RNA polymerase elongator complex component)